MELIYWIIFLMNNLSRRERYKLLEIYKLPQIILTLTKEELFKNGILLNEELSNKEKINAAKSMIKDMKKYSIQFINIYDERYPVYLKTIYDPPIGLFVLGNYNCLNQNILSIVGCRACSDYGKKTAFNMAKEISKYNIVIASGLAKGIDAYAHLGTISVKQKTIAVLGSGVNIIYPKENKNIYEDILKCNGAIISEYLLSTKPLKHNFPERNRIISGISKGVLVIEAKERSGTLITVDFALEQGRDIYAIPGNICSNNSYGTNELIKQGAKLVTNCNDILEDFI